MQAQMFKDVKAATSVAQKKKGKQPAAAAAEKPKAGVQAKEKAVRAETTARGKKNRKERRKDQRKEKRRDIKKRVKEEKAKLLQETT